MAGKSDAFYEAYVSVIPTAKGFERSLNQQMTGQSAIAGGVAGGAAGKGFAAGFGRAIPIIGTVLAAAGLGDIIGNAIEDGSTYQQAQGAVEQVFGALGAQAIESFAEGGAKSVGQSMNDILQSSSLLGIFGKAAGLADTELVDFSKNLITLGADLAAFANTSPADAVEALSAGLRGESEPLRKYGVLLDDATLKARAMELGIYDGSGSLTQQQRILAAYNEILAQTTDQQGQFSRESDTLAGKQARVAAAWENISTRIGVAFLPVAEQLIGVVETELIPALEDFAAWLNEPGTIEGIKTLGAAVIEVGNFVRDWFIKPFVGTVQAGKALFDLLSGDTSIQGFVAKLQTVPGPFGDIVRAVTDAATQYGRWIGSMILHVQKFASEVGTNIGRAVQWFRDLPGEIGRAVSNAGNWLVQTGRDLISGLVNGIRGAADSVRRAIGGVVTGAIDWAKSLLGINSPSKVFAEIGEYTSQGYAQGIRADYGVVRSAAAGMSSVAVNAVGSGFGPGDRVVFEVEGTPLTAVAKRVVSADNQAKSVALAGGVASL